jgi:hypothetical protein
MKRLKWMRVTSAVTIRDMAKQLQKAAFREGLGSGFLLDRARDRSLDARYIERLEFVESFLDPFGKNQVVERVAYKEVGFTLSKGFPELELRMPPRGLTAFMNGLMKASGFSMSIEGYSVDLLRWAKGIERSLGVKAAIRGALASDIELEGGATARIAVVAPKDARPGLTEVLMGKQYKLRSLQIEYSWNSSLQRVVLSSDCAIQYSERLTEDELDAIRDALEEIVVH